MRRRGEGGKGLARCLRWGAWYDWILAAAILWAPAFLLRLLHFPPPPDAFLFRLTALPPALFPLVYLAAAADPLGRPELVRVSVGIRSIGGLLLAALVLWHRPTGFFVYLGTAAADLAWGGVQRALAGRAGVWSTSPVPRREASA